MSVNEGCIILQSKIKQKQDIAVSIYSRLRTENGNIRIR